MYIYYWHKIIGVWRIAREVTQDTAEQWLKVYQDDEPNGEGYKYFRIGKRKPRINPNEAYNPF